MYEKNDKRRLYWLIDEYLNSNIDESTFCDEFYYSYSLEINSEDLIDVEKKAFYELDQILTRFSEFESDQKLDTNAFSTKDEVKKKAIEVKNNLHGTWDKVRQNDF